MQIAPPKQAMITTLSMAVTGWELMSMAAVYRRTNLAPGGPLQTSLLSCGVLETISPTVSGQPNKTALMNCDPKDTNWFSMVSSLIEPIWQQHRKQEEDIGNLWPTAYGKERLSEKRICSSTCVKEYLEGYTPNVYTHPLGSGQEHWELTEFALLNFYSKHMLLS